MWLACALLPPPPARLVYGWQNFPKRIIIYNQQYTPSHTNIYVCGSEPRHKITHMTATTPGKRNNSLCSTDCIYLAGTRYSVVSNRQALCVTKAYLVVCVCIYECKHVLVCMLLGTRAKGMLAARIEPMNPLSQPSNQATN